ncbi:MAG: universal stress protein [Deltaproteobacteria bacterium]|nr:universal stress protein [Deltaproteobacteria bacterium]
MTEFQVPSGNWQRDSASGAMAFMAYRLPGSREVEISMIEKILVATDGSEASASAERFAVSLAARLKATLHGLAVVEDSLIRGMREDGLGVPPPRNEEMETYLKERATAICRRLTERGRSAGLEIRSESLRGIADDCITERGRSAHLLVIGRNGVNATFRTGLIGSVADAVLRKTQKPALVVPPGADLSGPIILGFDGSPGSKRATDLAKEMALRLQVPLHIFVDSKDKDRAVVRFSQARQLLGDDRLTIHESASTLGRPEMKIVECAKNVNAGLIVMGAYGRNRITEYFMGSNAASVVRTSPVAVLLAR